MRLLAGEAETVAFLQVEVALADPELELAAQHVAGFLALVAVTLFTVGTGGEA
ncbi:hypothetical protein D3C84_1212130 [compost metagenome]